MYLFQEVNQNHFLNVKKYKHSKQHFKGGKIMRTWCVDFENEELGIYVYARTKEQAVEIAKNPCNWKDGKKRKVSSVYEFQKGNRNHDKSRMCKM